MCVPLEAPARASSHATGTQLAVSAAPPGRPPSAWPPRPPWRGPSPQTDSSESTRPARLSVVEMGLRGGRRASRGEGQLCAPSPALSHSLREPAGNVVPVFDDL